MQSPVERKPGVYTYTAPWPIYTVAWSARSDRLAVGSFLDDCPNKVQLVDFDPSAAAAATSSPFTTHDDLLFDHPFAPTNLMFSPDPDPAAPDLVATSGDSLRLWQVHPDRVELRSLLGGGGNTNNNQFSSPITSFDWAAFEPRRVAAASIDTSCTVWDVEREAVDTQLVAHEKEVYDVSWGAYNVFASVSGDGSLRVFDLRDKERSTIIYENATRDSPLLRLEWNRTDPRFIATVGMDSGTVVILDIRFPTTPFLELAKHRGSVNAVSWSPRTGSHICSVGDDSTALIWEVVESAGLGGDVEPQVWYGSTAEINQVRWSDAELDCIAISYLNKLQILKV